MNKNIFNLLLLLILPLTLYSQRIEYGNYCANFDYFSKFQFKILLELNEDSCYKFTYIDNTQKEITQGKWNVIPGSLILFPYIIPDTIKIVEVFEISNSALQKNIIGISNNGKGIPDLFADIFQSNQIKNLKTDSLGEIQYDGEPADSIIFSYKNKKLQTILKNKEKASIARISVDTNYRDLVFRQLGRNSIGLKNGKIFLKYKEGEKQETKIKYFERIN